MQEPVDRTVPQSDPQMLFDVFISHASEDKDIFVRPLAEQLKERRIEVWYDEFSLLPGDSLRQSIDRGLSKSRYGVVVLSPRFFAKPWPQWELDGLVQRHLKAVQKVIIPVWLGITHDDILQFSAPLADLIAIQADRGVDFVVEELLQVLHPRGSTLLVARDYLITYGCEPPVVTDDWWLDVVERSGVGDVEGTFQEAMCWGRWGFPLPEHSRDPQARGWRVGWTAMQMLWQAEAERRPITQITHPDEVHSFIKNQPGLQECTSEFPHYAAAYAPQLTLPGFGGHLENLFEIWLEDTVCDAKEKQRARNKSGTGLTVDGTVPTCPDVLALHHKTFGGYDPAVIASNFVGGPEPFGPTVRLYETIDYVAWFLSDASSWFPESAHAFLIEGLKRWAAWLWHGHELECPQYDGAGSMASHLFERSKKRRRTLSKAAIEDLRSRLAISAQTLSLPESGEELASRFIDYGFFREWCDRQERRTSRHHKTSDQKKCHEPDHREG